MVLPLLLKNSPEGKDRNACFANSIVNILRRIETVRQVLPALVNEKRLHFLLQQLFSAEGSTQSQSTFFLRDELAKKSGKFNFSSGIQNDAKEFLDALLEKLPTLSNMFKFKITRKYSFVNSKYAPKCQYCFQEENPVTSPPDTTLLLYLLPSNSMSLQNLIDDYFKFKAGFKKCSNNLCDKKPKQAYNEFSSVTETGSYIFIQLLRFTNNLQKISNFVQGSFRIRIGNFQFKLIGIVNHLGNFNNGHY